MNLFVKKCQISDVLPSKEFKLPQSERKPYKLQRNYHLNSC